MDCEFSAMDRLRNPCRHAWGDLVMEMRVAQYENQEMGRVDFN